MDVRLRRRREVIEDRQNNAQSRKSFSVASSRSALLSVYQSCSCAPFAHKNLYHGKRVGGSTHAADLDQLLHPPSIQRKLQCEKESIPILKVVA